MRIPEIIPSKTEESEMIKANLNNSLRVACPGIIQAFDIESQTATVRLCIRESITNDIGASHWVEIPPLLDLPILIPRAGGYMMTLPIKTGDECLVVFSDMCIDGWFVHGGVQNQMEKRRHDLSDGICIPGIWSQPNRVKDYSTTSCQIRNEEGSSYIELSGDDVNIVAKGNINLSAASVKSNNLDINTHTHTYSGGETSDPH